LNPEPLDEDLLAHVEAGAPHGLRTWEPASVSVVLGRGNSREREVRERACEEDAVPVLRRLGGGGAVVLAPGCLVVSVAKVVEREFDASYLLKAAALLGSCLEAVTGLAPVLRGTGDLCLGDRKVLGSSLYRRRRLLFYQASLLVCADLSLFDRYLKHPSREPEYRRGRSHGDFVMNLRDAQPGVTCRRLSERLEEELFRRIPEIE
jgi:lipoate---protein ligase